MITFSANSYRAEILQFHAEKTLRSLCLWMMASINASGDKGCGGSVVSVSLVHALTARNLIVISRRKALHLKLQAVPQTTALQASIFASMEEVGNTLIYLNGSEVLTNSIELFFRFLFAGL
jgi:hypothetical protein